MVTLSKKVSLLSLLALGIIVFLAVDVVLLTIQNRELKNRFNSTTMLAQTSPLQPGDKVESFSFTTLSGTAQELAYRDPTHKYLLLILSASCPHCERTLPHWNTIASSANSEQCFILGLCLQDLQTTKKYAADKSVEFYLAVPDTNFSRKYKITGLPTTILLSGNGIVQKVWIGALTEDQTSEIKNLLGTNVASTNQLNQ